MNRQGRKYVDRIGSSGSAVAAISTDSAHDLRYTIDCFSNLRVEELNL